MTPLIPSLQGIIAHDDESHHGITCENEICHPKDREGDHADAMAGHHQSSMHHAASVGVTTTWSCNCQKGQEAEMILAMKYRFDLPNANTQYSREEPKVLFSLTAVDDIPLEDIFRPPIILS